ncbi:MAG: chromate transporter [Bryobacteraceae bacterium]
MDSEDERDPAASGAPTSSVTAGPAQPSLLGLSAAYFRIGNTTFGGGVPTMAALQRELVHRKRWLSPEEYGLAFALARVTPGTNILAFVAATGSQILGLAGALAGTLAVTIPSAILALMITVGYERWSSNPIVLAGIEGTVAAVSGMMIATVWSLIAPFWGGLKPSGRMQTFRTSVFAGGAFLLLWLWDVSPLQIIVLALVGGLLWEDPSVEKGSVPK